VAVAPRFDELIHPSTRLSNVSLLAAADWVDHDGVGGMAIAVRGTGSGRWRRTAHHRRQRGGVTWGQDVPAALDRLGPLGLGTQGHTAPLKQERLLLQPTGVGHDRLRAEEAEIISG